MVIAPTSLVVLSPLTNSITPCGSLSLNWVTRLTTIVVAFWKLLAGSAWTTLGLRSACLLLSSTFLLFLSCALWPQLEWSFSFFVLLFPQRFSSCPWWSCFRLFPTCFVCLSALSGPVLACSFDFLVPRGDLHSCCRPHLRSDTSVCLSLRSFRYPVSVVEQDTS